MCEQLDEPVVESESEHRHTVSFFIKRGGVMPTKLEKFKETKEGKYIRAFGTLLIVSAVCTLLSIILCLISATISSELIYVGYATVMTPASIFLFVVGPKIRRYDYSPSKLHTIAIATIFIGLFASLRLFIVIEAIILLTNWNKKYKKAYLAEGAKNVPLTDTEEEEEEEDSVPAEFHGEGDEYEDGLL